MKRKFLAGLLLFVMAFGIFAMLPARKGAEAASDLKPLPADNTGESNPSTLIPFSDGYYRVFAKDDYVWVETYDSNFNIQSRKKLSKELDLYGGCFAGKNAYFLVFGQNNTEESTSKEILRVVKYSKSWVKQGTAKITGKDQFAMQVGYIFHLGYPDMVEVNGTLYITCGHRGYVDESVGQGHQGMLLFTIDESTMTGEITDADLWHSFSQDLAAKDEDHIYILEESEGSQITKLSQIEYDERAGAAMLLEYGGTRTSVWSVPTYATADDIEVSSSNILCVGTSIDQSKYEKRSNGEVVPYNVYLTVTPVNNMASDSTTLKWITTGGATNSEYKGVHLTKINNDRFLLSYENGYNEDSVAKSGVVDALSTHVLHYQFIDGNGNKIGSAKKAAAPFTACRPIVNDGQVVFYGSNEANVGFYTINAETGAFKSKIYRMAGEKADWSYKSGVVTVSGSGELFNDLASNSFGAIKNDVTKIIIKKGIDKVSDKAFRNLPSLDEVVIEDGLTSIGGNAFYGMCDFKRIVIPDSVTSIADDAFYTGWVWTDTGEPVIYVTIVCYKDSYAHKYAKKNKISVELIPEFELKTTTYNGTSGLYYLKRGKVYTAYTGFASNDDGWWYVENGKVSKKKNGIIQGTVDGTKAYWYVKNSKVTYTNTVAKDDRGWWVIRNGKIDTSFTGFAKNENGWWYAEKGKVSQKKTGIIQGTVDGTKAYWYVKNSKVTKTDTVAKDDRGWWCIKKGRIDTSFTGFAKNENGWWYCEKGKVNFDKKDIIQGTVNGTKAWWFVSGGQVQFVDSVEKNSNGWWCIQKGKVNFDYTGFAKNNNGWWYCEKGKVNFSKKDVIQGVVNGEKAWWFVNGGQVKFVDSVEKNSNGWWCIQNGRVNFDFTGIAKNSNGSWYCKGGKVQFDYSGNITYAGKKYKIKAGKVVQ